MISPQDTRPRDRVQVLDSEIAFVDTGGEGETIVLLHGNPTSSYLWRNVIDELEDRYRCVAPDLVGMGSSGPNPSGSYRLVDHVRFLDAWFDGVMPTERVALVVHDWGSALGFHWARRHPDRVSAIVYMEAFVCPLTWEDWPQAAQGIFEGLRSPAGEKMVLENNVFVERLLPGGVLRDLGEEEMVRYREPYLEPGESRRPTLDWPREIPLDGQPDDVARIVQVYANFLASNEDLPKLFVNADPGGILTGRQREFCRSWPNQAEVTVRGSHFVQEDSPAEIGFEIRRFLAGVQVS